MGTKREKQKSYYDRGSKLLPVLNDGDKVIFKRNGKEWTYGKIVRNVDGRSYVIIDDFENYYRRNRRFIVRTNNNDFDTSELLIQDRQNELLNELLKGKTNDNLTNELLKCKTNDDLIKNVKNVRYSIIIYILVLVINQEMVLILRHDQSDAIIVVNLATFPVNVRNRSVHLVPVFIVVLLSIRLLNVMLNDPKLQLFSMLLMTVLPLTR